MGLSTPRGYLSPLGGILQCVAGSQPSLLHIPTMGLRGPGEQRGPSRGSWDIPRAMVTSQG